VFGFGLVSEFPLFGYRLGSFVIQDSTLAFGLLTKKVWSVHYHCINARVFTSGMIESAKKLFKAGGVETLT